MTAPADLLPKMRGFIEERAAGFLINPIREYRTTCLVCLTPTGGYPKCYPCKDHFEAAGTDLADHVGVVTYAIEGQQSGSVMRQYKAPTPPAGYEIVVTSLGWIGVQDHLQCLERISGSAVTHWSTVPSLPAKQTQHRLRRLPVPAMPGTEAPLTAAPAVSDPRALEASHFTAPPLPPDSHVLLVNDTWARGGHAQSAALALRAASAQTISTLIIARWLNPKFGGSTDFIKERLQADFDLTPCPWTQGICPT